MRAYMSTFGRRVLPLRDGFPSDASALAWSAESEARAILAETEPQGCGSYQRLTWLGDWSGDVAKALAGFIGMEC